MAKQSGYVEPGTFEEAAYIAARSDMWYRRQITTVDAFVAGAKWAAEKIRQEQERSNG